MNAKQNGHERRLLKTSAAARYLSTGVKQMRALAQRGEIPVVILHEHGKWYFDRHDLDEFIEAHKRGSAWELP